MSRLVAVHTPSPSFSSPPSLLPSLSSPLLSLSSYSSQYSHNKSLQRRKKNFLEVGRPPSVQVCLEPPSLHHCPFSFPPSFLLFLLPCSPTQPSLLSCTTSVLQLSSSLPVGTGVDRELQRLLTNERANFKLLAEKVRKGLTL